VLPPSYTLRGMWSRKGGTLTSIFAIALVVFVIATSGMLENGIARALDRTSHPDVALVLHKGANTELGSAIERDTVAQVLLAPGIAKDAAGEPIASPELVMIFKIKRSDGAGLSNVTVRGVPAQALGFRGGTIVAGRAPAPGAFEGVVGRQIRGRFEGAELGDALPLKRNRTLSVVGAFEAAGSLAESELWLEAATLGDVSARQGTVSSIRVKLDGAGGMAALKAFLAARPTLGLEVIGEGEYYEQLTEGSLQFVRTASTAVAVLLSIAAMLGAMIAMYASVARRRMEVATLRVMGFRQGSVLATFLFELLLLGVAGAIVGVLASVPVSAMRFSVINYASWSEVVYGFESSPRTFVIAVVSAFGMGLVGGIVPAVRASRMDPLAVLRG
jgi:putative ABC transport system permease protein